MTVLDSALAERAPVTPPNDVPAGPPGRQGATWSEIAVFACCLVALVVVELTVLNAWPAVTRPLWLDEIHTYLLAGTQGVVESFRSLAAGADYNPPALYLLYRVLAPLVGGLSEVSMRLVALASVVGAITISYALLRAEFTRLHAGLATLATWAHPVVVNVAFDARFYGPWLVLAAWLIVETSRRIGDRNRAGRWSDVRLATASVLLCTIHWFGILSWGSVMIVAALRLGILRAVRRMLPAMAGPVALAFCVPLYRGQRAVLTVPTWIPDPTFGDVVFLLVVVFLPVATTIVLAAWVLDRLLRRLTRRGAATAPALRFGLASRLMMAQAIVPVTLAVFSLLILPATQPRYWIVGALAMAPVLARAFAGAGALAPVAALAALVSSVNAVRSEGDAARLRARVVAEDIEQIGRLTEPGSLIVTRRRHTLYPLLRARPDLAPRLAYLDATPAHPTDRFAIVERDAARAHARIYGFPRIESTTALSRLEAFYLIELDPSAAPEPEEFPGDSIARVGHRLFRLQRR